MDIIEFELQCIENKQINASYGAYSLRIADLSRLNLYISDSNNQFRLAGCKIAK